MKVKPEEFITAMYPVSDIYVLWEDVDDTKPAGQRRRKPPEYGAERARFLALCADGRLRAVVFGEWEYTLQDFEDGVCNQGIYTGEGLARFMPKAKISFWDGSKDPRPDFLKAKEAMTDDLPHISDYWNTLLKKCCERIPMMYQVFLRQCKGMEFHNGELTIEAPDIVIMYRLDNERVKRALLELSGAERISFCYTNLSNDDVPPPEDTPSEAATPDDLEAHRIAMGEYAAGQTVSHDAINWKETQ